MPADTIAVICVVLGYFAIFLTALGYGQWTTRHLD